MCLPRLAAFRFVCTLAPRCQTSAVLPAPRCQTFVVHARSTLSNVRCTRPVPAVKRPLYCPLLAAKRPLYCPLHAVKRSLYTPAPRCQTFAVHARSTLSNVRCTRPLHAVKRSLYTPAQRCQTSAVHARSTLPNVRCTRQLHDIKHPLYTPAPRCQTSAVHAGSSPVHTRSTLPNIRCTRPLAVVHARSSLSSSCCDGTVGWSAVSTVSFVTDLVVYVENATSRHQCCGFRSLTRAASSISAFSLYLRATTDEGPAMTVNDTFYSFFYTKYLLQQLHHKLPSASRTQHCLASASRRFVSTACLLHGHGVTCAPGRLFLD